MVNTTQVYMRDRIMEEWGDGKVLTHPTPRRRLVPFYEYVDFAWRQVRRVRRENLIDCRSNRSRLWMLNGKLIQALIVASACLAKLAFSKRKVAVGVETCSDTEGFC